MAHKSLKLTATLALLVAVGCSSSVDLDLEPTATAPAPADTQQPANEPAAEPPPERVAADRPVNQSPGTGYLGGVAAAHRSARERVEDLAMTSAIRLFWGTEGRYPESHEEFMEKVVKANQMRLPPIEEGYEYQYDPEDQTLYKVRIEDPATSLVE